jgi:hypothetical protein
MLDLLIPILVPLVVLGATTGIMLLVLEWWRNKIRKRNRRSPLTRKMLRSPGETLRTEIEELDAENTFVIIMTFMGPFLLYSITLSQIHFSSRPNPTVSWIGFLVIGVAALVYFLRQIFANFETIRRKRLGMEGEIATGEELNQLMLHGCRVFHDLPFEYGNIDHVVVSQSGVFSVETKTLAKSNESGSEKVTVDFTNNRIQFSDWNWGIPFKQLETNSRWLSQYLSNATGMRIEAEAMLALPGYYIEKRIGKSNVFVFNPKQPKKFFSNSRVVFTPEQVQQIAHQVEQLCRDVEPSFGHKSKTE